MGFKIVLHSVTVIFLLMFMSGCASKRPVIYPNEKAKAVGDAVVQADIDACVALAQASGADNDRGGQVATDTAANAAIGGGTGVLVGAIAGNAGRGALVGAAGAGVATLLRGAFTSSAPGAVHQRFVAECLDERGYRMIGWS